MNKNSRLFKKSCPTPPRLCGTDFVVTKSGFTLIELLVVIVIIGILATLATIALGSARSKTRDAKRVSDIKQLQTALNLYYTNEGAYPDTITFGAALVGPKTGNKYIDPVPNNPTPREHCPDANYSYAQFNGGADYALSFCLSGAVAELQAGEYYAVKDSYTLGSIGYYLDEAVVGLNFQGDLGSSGKTGARGGFYYKKGEKMSFFVGKSKVGEINGDNIPSDNNVFVTDAIPEIGPNYRVSKATDVKAVLIGALIQSIATPTGDNALLLDPVITDALPEIDLLTTTPLPTAAVQSAIVSVGKSIVTDNPVISHLQATAAVIGNGDVACVNTCGTKQCGVDSCGNSCGGSGGNCGGTDVCSADGHCVACVGNNNCGGSTPVCSLGICVACSTNTDCLTCKKCENNACVNQLAGEDFKAECGANAVTCTSFIAGWNSNICNKYSANATGNGACDGAGACTANTVAAACANPVQSGTAVCGSASCAKPSPACDAGAPTSTNDELGEVCYTDNQPHGACTAPGKCDASGNCAACTLNTDCPACQKCSSGSCVNEVNEDLKGECAAYAVDCTKVSAGPASATTCNRYTTNLAANGTCNAGVCTVKAWNAVNVCSGSTAFLTCGSAECRKNCQVGDSIAGATLSYACYTSGTGSCTGGKTCNASGTCVCASAPAAPTSITVVDNGNNTVTVSWPAVSGATAYKLYARRSPNFTYGSQLVYSGAGTSYTSGVLVEGDLYHYAVAAVNGCSADSGLAVSGAETIGNFSVECTAGSAYGAKCGGGYLICKPGDTNCADSPTNYVIAAPNDATLEANGSVKADSPYASYCDNYTVDGFAGWSFPKLAATSPDSAGPFGPNNEWCTLQRRSNLCNANNLSGGCSGGCLSPNPVNGILNSGYWSATYFDNTGTDLWRQQAWDGGHSHTGIWSWQSIRCVRRISL